MRRELDFRSVRTMTGLRPTPGASACDRNARRVARDPGWRVTQRACGRVVIQPQQALTVDV